MMRKCADCPGLTQAVCCHAFGKFWNDKSRNGEGCEYPMDGVAESWKARDWMPEREITKAIALSLADASTVSLTQLKMPRRPKVSADIRRQAELFFGRLK